MSQEIFRLTAEELAYRQSLPLSVKEKMAVSRIREFVNYFGSSGSYVSFSGGLDSLVTLHLTREQYGDRNVAAVFLDTWLEFPQLRAFVKTFDNVVTIKPKLSMKEIIETCGWCFPSKEVAALIEAMRRDDVPNWAKKKINGLDKHGNPDPYRQCFTKPWIRKLIDADILISPGCCLEMKEKPVMEYEAAHDTHPILGLRAEESARRKNAYLKTGCLNCHGERPNCKPIGFFTKQDILHYVKKYNLSYASPYGEILPLVGGKKPCAGQCLLFEPDESVPLGCTGEDRTGCMFCPVGGHLDGFSKLKRLKKYSPTLFDYCMDELGEKHLIDWVRNNMNVRVEL